MKRCLKEVLPRHLQIVREINRRFIEIELKEKWDGKTDQIRRMSIVSDGSVRMAFLSEVGSHSVNGVAALHTKLLKEKLLSDFAELYPARFNNKTNGITPRRWLIGCNPQLSELITSAIGTDWAKHLDLLRGLEKFADDSSFQEDFLRIKRTNKEVLSTKVLKEMGLGIDPESMYDSQIKRLHEYKRQHLNLLHILTLYRRLLHDPGLDISPRVFIFGQKQPLVIILPK